MDFKIIALDHVQLAMPPQRESEAERFYVGLLGFERVQKPPPLEAKGGCWFRTGGVHLHLGVEQDFRPAKKAHPALIVSGLDALCAKLQSSGIAVRPDEELPGVRRCYVDDPFGNRIELIQGRDARRS
jgi:catechol 2,3-dioxygenase-like lactoylglutathione lyase family enzyme